MILDLDDTLFDDGACTRAGLAAVAAGHHVDHCPPQELFTRHAGHIRDIDPLLFRKEVTAHAARVLRFTRLLSDLGVTQPDGEAATHTYRAAYRSAWKVLDGADALLRELRARGLRAAVLTNYVREVQLEKLSHFGLDGLVDAVLCIEDVPAPKPDPRAYHAACAALGVSPAEAVMVGDSWEKDVQGARAAGLRAIWLHREGQTAPDPQVPQSATLAGVLPLLG